MKEGWKDRAEIGMGGQPQTPLPARDARELIQFYGDACTGCPAIKRRNSIYFSRLRLLSTSWAVSAVGIWGRSWLWEASGDAGATAI